MRALARIRCMNMAIGRDSLRKGGGHHHSLDLVMSKDGREGHRKEICKRRIIMMMMVAGQKGQRRVLKHEEKEGAKEVAE
jgi:hypothetical protein